MNSCGEEIHPGRGECGLVLPSAFVQTASEHKNGHTGLLYFYLGIFTPTANSAGVYTLKQCAPGPRSASTFSGDSEHLASVQTYYCCFKV